MLHTKVLEEIKTHILCSVFFFFENRTVYEIMWRNIVEPGRPQITIWRMRIACWITKATNTHPEYVILIAFHRNNGCRNAPKCYFIRTLHVLFNATIAYPCQNLPVLFFLLFYLISPWWWPIKAETRRRPAVWLYIFVYRTFFCSYSRKKKLRRTWIILKPGPYFECPLTRYSSVISTGTTSSSNSTIPWILCTACIPSVNSDYFHYQH